MTLIADDTTEARRAWTTSRDGELEECWQKRPSLANLRQGLDLAHQLPLARQTVWSRRARDAGLWGDCPLVRVAQDPSVPLPERALAAAAAWSLERDRRARAVLRCIIPALGPDELPRLNSVMSTAAWNDLDKGPFVWSVTPFFNELDMLEARLREMAREVDRFVLIEARQTHRGEPKPLYFEEARARFSAWSPQIDYCVIDLPADADDWGRERAQRDVGRNILMDLQAADDDLVLLTDLDEIVPADRAQAVMEATSSGPVVLQMTQYWYNLGWKEPGQWRHPKAFRVGQIPPSVTYSDVRHMAFPVVPEAGWHLSWFGRTEQFAYKLRSFAHAEYDTEERRSPQFQQHLQESGTDIHGRTLLRSPCYFPSSTSSLFSLEAP